jgi:hypothetical protein
MQIHRKKDQNIESGISLSQTSRKRLSIYLQSKSQIKGISKSDYKEYREGQRTFMPFRHMRLMIEQFDDDFFDFVFEP